MIDINPKRNAPAGGTNNKKADVNLHRPLVILSTISNHYDILLNSCCNFTQITPQNYSILTI